MIEKPHEFREYIYCPHCDVKFNDDYGVMEHETRVVFTCLSCKKKFSCITDTEVTYATFQMNEKEG